jgi:pimeloyl-ACP methyl ester carboxylesterase
MPQTFKKIAIKIVQWAVLLYLLVCIGIAFCQSSLLFHPTKRPNANKEWTTEDIDSRAPAYAGVVFSSEFPTNIYLMFHGNGGQADDREYMYKLLPPNSALYVMEYPTYGKRGGIITEASINATALRSYDYLSKTRPYPITIIGESLGVGPAAYVASRRRVRSLILITPYRSLPQLCQEHVGFLPVYWLCTYRWDLPKLLQKFEGKLTIVGAHGDEVVPVSHARTLSKDFPDAKLYIIDGGHNSWDKDSMREVFEREAI